uniref:Ovule protein n=1 Tax=Romanomermis culicivorax TaxID=13658 RepID=A0A915IVV3_ROMCU
MMSHYVKTTVLVRSAITVMDFTEKRLFMGPSKHILISIEFIYYLAFVHRTLKSVCFGIPKNFYLETVALV